MKRELDVYRQQLLSRYLEQPTDLEAAVEAQADVLHEPLAHGEWSPHQVLAHVEAAERLAFKPRVHRILSEDKPQLENWDESEWMDSEYDATATAAHLLASIRSTREEILEILTDLPSLEWSRTGTHKLRGERTLQYWIEYAVAHAEDHLNQLSPS